MPSKLKYVVSVTVAKYSDQKGYRTIHDYYIRIVLGTRRPSQILASGNYSLKISTGHRSNRNNDFVKSLVMDLLCCVNIGTVADLEVEIVALGVCTLVRGRKQRFGQSLHPWLSQSIVHDLESQH